MFLTMGRHVTMQLPTWLTVGPGRAVLPVLLGLGACVG